MGCSPPLKTAEQRRPVGKTRRAFVFSEVATDLRPRDDRPASGSRPGHGDLEPRSEPDEEMRSGEEQNGRERLDGQEAAPTPLGRDVEAEPREQGRAVPHRNGDADLRLERRAVRRREGPTPRMKISDSPPRSRRGPARTTGRPGAR